MIYSLLERFCLQFQNLYPSLQLGHEGVDTLGVGGAKVEIAGELSLEALEGGVLGGGLCTLGKDLMGDGAYGGTGIGPTCLFQSNSKGADQLVDKLHHFGRHSGIAD